MTAGKPGLGFGLSVLAGISNIILDYVFIVLWDPGVRGAALGTGFGYLIPTIAGLICFAQSKGTLYFTRPAFRWAVVRESCFNGASEMVGQLATAVTTFLFNGTMMDLLGEDGVRQKKVFRISMGFIAAASLLIFSVSMFGGSHIVRLFTGNESEIYDIASDGFTIFSFSFLFCGLNNFTSAMFTALSNATVSAVLSFLRTFGLLAGALLLLPRIWGTAGVWLAVPAAEGVMFFVSVLCLIHFRKRYSY